MLLEALTPEDPSNFSWKFRNVTLYEDPQTLIYESKGKGCVFWFGREGEQRVKGESGARLILN